LMKNSLQLFLPLERDPLRVKDLIERLGGRPVSLTITDNSSSMLSIREQRGIVYVRLHRMFLDAGEDVLKEIVLLVKRRRGETPLLRNFLKQNGHRIRKPHPRKPNIRLAGSRRDLGKIYEALNREYFCSRISCAITWGAKGAKRAVRKRTLGSYCRRTDTIRINPVLDSKTVPEFFLEFVVYHEMLHADIAVSEKNGRRQVHSKEFKKREKLFRQYDRATAWEKGKRL
jgi:predicted metal-dependent hydrolase